MELTHIKYFLEVARNCEETFGKETREPEVWFAE